MALIFEYTGGEKKPEINKVLKQSQKKNYVTAEDLNSIASWLNNISGFVKNLDDTKLDKDKALTIGGGANDAFPAVSGLLLKQQIGDIEDQITDLNDLVNTDHMLKLTGDVSR
jgi:hypothetical protein